METIATLGPEGTFSDQAAKQYLREFGDVKQISGIRYFKSIKSAFKAVGNACDFGVLPIENLSEGYVELVLDLLLGSDLQIIHELLLPIQFSFVSPSKTLKDVKTVFVQYVAEGQCGNFIDTMPGAAIVRTDSNMESLELLKKADVSAGAIVPHHGVADLSFPLVIPNVDDYKNNVTRFIVLARQGAMERPTGGQDYKTSIIVMDEHDYPGLLVKILMSFSKRNINLTSIMSRPAKTTIGKYHFFIDAEGHRQEPPVKEALEEISALNKLKILGSYPRAHCTSPK